LFCDSFFSGESANSALVDNRFKPRKYSDDYSQANEEIVLLDDIQTNQPALFLRPVKREVGAVSGVGLASLGQAVSSGASMWQRSGLYQIVVPNADLARRLATGTAEFVPSKIAGLFSGQVREIGGPAIGQTLLRSAGSVGNAAAACASVFGALSAIAMDMRLRSIETAIENVSEKINDMVDIELQTKIESAIAASKDLLNRLKAIELNTDPVDPIVLQLQRSDLDSRLRDAQKNGVKVTIATKLWLENEMKKLENASNLDHAFCHVQMMWKIHVAAHKVLILLAHVECEKETVASWGHQSSSTSFFELPATVLGSL
jgi:hypothetical protein